MAEILPRTGQEWAQAATAVVVPQTVREAEPIKPLAPISARSERVARIISVDNGAGLSRERAIVAQIFERAGWRVSYVHPHDAMNEVARVAVNVHLETCAPSVFDLADRNIVVPNPEWWVNEIWTPMLRHPSALVWAKTEDAARVFERLGGRVERVGFRSIDQQDLTVQRERAFLHVGGKSPNKATDVLVAAWRAEWPKLTVVTSAPRYAGARSNVEVLAHLSDEEIRELQNRHVFHIYPSRYEGFGHAQWEGLSCGAVVFVTEGPPFDEFPEAFQFLTSTEGVLAENRLIPWRMVKPESIEFAVKWSQALSDADLESLRQQARTVWEDRTKRFEENAASIVTTGRAAKKLADLPPLTYVGRVNCVTGYGTAARHQIHALRKHGAKISVFESGSTASPDPTDQDDFVRSVRRSDVEQRETRGTIFHIAPNFVERYRRDFPRPHILVSVWETTRLPSEWVSIINQFDQVWCATDWQRDVYRHSGVNENILRTVPFALDPELYEVDPQPREKDGRTIFGSVFQWTERKNPIALIGAFLQSFTGHDPVTLILKSYEEDNPTTSVVNRVDEVVRMFNVRHALPDIRVISRPMSNRDMIDFYRSIDCYVSAHCGEGFGFPIAESLLLGRPVIATDWSAPAEFAKGCYRAVNYTLAPPHGMNWQPFYSVDQSWARVDVADLGRAMKDFCAGRVEYSIAKVRSTFAALTERAGEAANAALREVLR
jgi:glycosyltransferase involved in cell wall biosynthesis